MIQRQTHRGKVYLSGPIAGLSYEEARFGWRMAFAGQLEQGITVLSPMRQEAHLEGTTALPARGSGPFASDEALVLKDFTDIKNCDLMVVNVLGAKKVSIGTVAEIGMAHALGKPIILIIEPANSVVIKAGQQNWYDLETGMLADPGYPPTYGSNIHDHPFVTGPATWRVQTVDEAVALTNAFLSEGL